LTIIIIIILILILILIIIIIIISPVDGEGEAAGYADHAEKVGHVARVQPLHQPRQAVPALLRLGLFTLLLPRTFRLATLWQRLQIRGGEALRSLRP
jgi:hypothetical protein